MPEGDTIFRAASTLHRALAGQQVTRFQTVYPHLSRIDDDHPITGRTVESVAANGKWMLMRFSGDLTLATHMRMNGSWHIYRPGEPWRRSRLDMRIVVATQPIIAVGFNIPVAELLTSKALVRHPSLSRLGPDVLSRDFDGAQALQNLKANPDLQLGEALLRQSVMAGLGNVYKSEVCFACRVHPFRRVASLTPLEAEALIATARKFLLANVSNGTSAIVTYTGFRRTTRRMDSSARLWVYRRAGEPCRRCGTPIESRKQGVDARTTFWCPACQPK